MRFVSLDTKTIDLTPDDKGQRRWIEVKKELSKGEDARFRTRGFRRMSQGKGDEAAEIDIDWTSLALARVEAYLVDWSATREVKGKPEKVPVNASAIAALDNASFDEIDAAIEAHIKEMADEKKVKAGQTAPTPTLQ